MFLTKQHLLMIITALFAGIISASAVPAYPRPITVTQSDGTQITIRVVGDEYNHQILSSDGYALVGGADNDYYYAKLNSGGALVASTVKAKPLNRLSAAERAVVNSIPKGLRSFRQGAIKRAMPVQREFSVARSVAGLNPPGGITNANTKGKLKSLIILVESSDINYTISSPQQAFTQMLMQKGYSQNGATGSAYDYYYANSNGQFDPEFVVVGPYKLAKTARYYAGADGTANAAEMIVEACKAADKDVNFTDFATGSVVRVLYFIRDIIKPKVQQIRYGLTDGILQRTENRYLATECKSKAMPAHRNLGAEVAKRWPV